MPTAPDTAAPDSTASVRSRRALFAAAGLGVAAAATHVTSADASTGALSAAAPKSSAAWHLARRVAHAPTPGMVAEITRLGASAWVNKQLAPATVSDTTCDTIIKTYFPWSGKTAAQVRAMSNDKPWHHSPHMVRETMIRQLFSNRVLLESMVEFFSDVLYVAAPSSKSDSVVGEFDWKVIRKHALGKFSDMLHASLTHAAMILWIDNQDSTKVRPNENLARELLELHTVGTGHYTETDVKNSALILTGHSLDWERLTYAFIPGNHHVGPVRVMGFSHANATASGGPAVLKAYATYLAKHPATAKRLCRRLAIRFVSDNPSSTLVNALAKTYLAAGTDIKPVLRQLFASAEFTGSVGKKLRRPAEFVTAMYKAANPSPTLKLDQPWAVNPWANLNDPLWLLEQAGHAPRSWPAVNGYPDVAEEWLGSNLMRTMWTSAEAASARWSGAVRLREKTWGLKSGQNAYEAAKALTMRITGYTWDQANLTRIASWLVGGNGQTKPSSTAKLQSWHVQYCQQAVRQVMASPYMLMR